MMERKFIFKMLSTTFKQLPYFNDETKTVTFLLDAVNGKKL